MTENEKSQTVVITRDWCKGCGICVAFCPKGALSLDDEGKASWVLPEKCVRCGLCRSRCPDIAVELE
jgi:2-oxoglutarate ferredoxin oxidoreductase subunit delta